MANKHKNGYYNFIDPLGVMPGNEKAKKSTGVPKPGAPPAQQGSANFYGNQLTSQTYQDPTYGTVTRYNPSAAEQQARTGAQNQISSLIPQIGQTSPEMSKQYDDIANAYADNETQAFNRQYDPAVRAQREDYANRFGGGQNTAYIDAMGNMENQVRTPALLNIANNAAQMKQQLYNQGDNQKINDLQALGYTLNNNQSTFLNNLQNPQAVTQNNNNFNQQNYRDLLNNYMNNQRLGSANTNQALQTIGMLGSPFITKALGTAATTAPVL